MDDSEKIREKETKQLGLFCIFSFACFVLVYLTIKKN